MSSLVDLEARVAALEAAQYDYRAVLAAANAMGANQREMAARQQEMAAKLEETSSRVRSLEDTTGEIKELLIRALER